MMKIKTKNPPLDQTGVKRRRAGQNEPNATKCSKGKGHPRTTGSNDGSKSQHKSAGKSAHIEEPMHTDKDLEEPTHQEFDIGAIAEQSDEETTQHPDWFQKPANHPTPGQYFFEEVYKATTDRLDWHNLEGQQFPHDLRKPLPLIPNSRGRQVIPFNHFMNNDLAYLSGGVSSRTYVTSIIKTQATNYGNINWIKDLVPNTMWSEVLDNYDKHAVWGISHWGRKCQQFYGFAANREFARDVYSKRRIIAVTKLQIVEWHGYKHLDWITVRRDDDKLYTFKEGDFKRLRLQDIKDMLILIVQGKPTNLNVEDHLAFGVSLRISDLKRKDSYTAYSIPRGFIYLNKDKKNRLMRIDELHKFSDGTLDDVRTALNDRLKGIRMEYLPKII
ncbi:hypothetical protein Tco_0924736 [Tanacetum coccineum]|uniref:Uncharacterized protein n=1 Tax=Tanacetum coccineum TaxID=301880 RepID=A0ABQ5D5T4_9ASTR